jgi:hypothetical protein
VLLAAETFLLGSGDHAPVDHDGGRAIQRPANTNETDIIETSFYKQRSESLDREKFD